MTFRKLAAVLLMTAILFGATSAIAADYKTKLSLTVPKSEANTSYDEAYVLEVPSDFTITAAGWNELGAIKISHATNSGDAFSSKKKVVVTAVSANSWSLVMSGDTTQTIGYTLKTKKDDTAATTEFTFTAEQVNAGASQDIGVDVEDYAAKKAGEYGDEITYTAEVADAETTITVTWNNDDITGSEGQSSVTKDGIAVISDRIDFNNKNVLGGGSFETDLGNFTKIVVTASAGFNSLGEGWTVNGTTATWEGTASDSVPFSGSMYEISSIVFTIEPTSQE